jgi:hypothetical protein
MADHKARCFCGAVEFSVSGEPVAMGYCHCESCRHWSAGPVNAFSLWQPSAVTVTQGADNIGIPDLKFQAGVHVNYQDTVLRVKDGLPKLKDFPKEMGGSGVVLPE